MDVYVHLCMHIMQHLDIQIYRSKIFIYLKCDFIMYVFVS